MDRERCQVLWSFFWGLTQMRYMWRLLAFVILASFLQESSIFVSTKPHSLLVDTDLNIDDYFGILYLLKQNRSLINVKAITISSNAWTDAGHAVNQLYDVLYMMDRDDIAVGVGGDGGILQNGTILPNVGGYLPLIEQDISTIGGCRYREAIPPGIGGQLDVNTNFGVRRGFLPQVFHSGIPITLIPLDATNTIPITKEFFMKFQRSQATYEAQYCFKCLKMARDTWFNNEFYTSYFMWDSFACGVAVSMMRKRFGCDGENEFAEMEYMNITIVTSNRPYGTSDGSNPFFNGRKVPKFNLKNRGVHSGHVQMGLLDPHCFVSNGKGKCQDGYTKEVTGSEAVQVLVATRAKQNKDSTSSLDREFFKEFLDVLSAPQQSGRFNLKTQYPYYKEVLYMPNLHGMIRGMPVVFDMDMSAGDFISLFYLLKVPVDVIDLKGIQVSGNGWANAATIDLIYDLLHMMGRDDIPVGLGSFFALGQANPLIPTVGHCKYRKAIPYGSGGFLDSDTLYGLSRTLPRSPRRYTAENSVKFGAPRDTEHPQLRQLLALDIWELISKTLSPGYKVTILTSGPLTNLANILMGRSDAVSIIKDVYIVGGYIKDTKSQRGNLFSVPYNEDAELNIFLDPLATKKVIESTLKVVLVPLNVQRKVSSFESFLQNMKAEKRPEARFVRRLLSRLYRLQQKHKSYHHVDIFLGEILGAVTLVGDPIIRAKMKVVRATVLANGNLSTDGQIVTGMKGGSLIRILSGLNETAYYDHLAKILGGKNQSAVVGSFSEQRRSWTMPRATNASKFIRS